MAELTAVAQKVRQYMKEHEEEFLERFRHLHQHPEMSFQEYETTAYIREKLTEWGIEIMDVGLETGVIGLLRGAKEGPCIALRADIDALPVTEESTIGYPSLNKGVMHACGHDTHMASLLGGAQILAAMRDELCGSVKFLFQPAEELNLGAKKFMELKCLENPKVDAIFGMHNSPEIPTGTVAVKNGPLMAAVDRINFTIKGKGGHGGIPQRNVDPIVAAAAIIQAAQTVVSRNTSPIDSAVISICNVKAGEGTTNNVTPDEVKMYGTVRTYRKEVETMIDRRLHEITESISAAYGCEGSLEYIYELAVTENNPTLYDVAYAAVTGAGAQPVDPVPSTGGEDFSEYTSKSDVPGFFYWLGTRNEENDCRYSWHSPHFKADEPCIAIGAGTYAMSVFEAVEALTKK
ncbi:MAG: M20 family metallopeptidase [Eubacteriales bacterium]|nr:M20 family metallopeptidase [Eubacteriales bacterium]